MDLYGFSVRGGLDVTHSVQWVIGTSFDVMELWSPRVRFRPSVEIASDAGSTVTFHWAGEIIYRFQPDNAPAIPYVGIGLGHMSNAALRRSGRRSRSASSCSSGRRSTGSSSTTRWIGSGRHRFLIGLSTRGGGGRLMAGQAGHADLAARLAFSGGVEGKAPIAHRLRRRGARLRARWTPCSWRWRRAPAATWSRSWRR